MPIRSVFSRCLVGLCLGCPGVLTSVVAQPSTEPAQGLWLAAQKDGVVEFKPCAEEPSALCGTVVWDRDAGPGKPGDCGLRIAKLRRKDDGVWRDGWVYDPREKKNYKGALRIRGEVLALRAYIGTELLGQTEEMSRVGTIPPGCPSAASASSQGLD